MSDGKRPHEDPKTGTLVLRVRPNEPVIHTVEPGDEFILDQSLVRLIRIKGQRAKFVVVACPQPPESA